MEDIAIYTGGKVIDSLDKIHTSKQVGEKQMLFNAFDDVAGSCDRLVTGLKTTTIVGGHGNKKDIQNRIKTIQAMLKQKSYREKVTSEKLEERFNMLASGVGIIYAGGITEIEIKDRYLRLEDAAQILQLFSIGGDELLTPLVSIKPRGMVHDASFAWQSGDKPGYKAYARLDRATTNAWKFIPAVNNVYGQVWLEKDKGQAVLERGGVTLDFPDLFRWPIDIDEMSGQVDWVVDGDSSDDYNTHQSRQITQAPSNDSISLGS